jgi:hypothetical protein
VFEDCALEKRVAMVRGEPATMIMYRHVSGDRPLRLRGLMCRCTCGPRMGAGYPGNAGMRTCAMRARTSGGSALAKTISAPGASRWSCFLGRSGPSLARSASHCAADSQQWLRESGGESARSSGLAGLRMISFES